MKPISAYVENFQSYQYVSLDFESQGLVLVSGPTGAGKSTALDILPWILYGTTSKDGAADDVRPWAETGETHGEAAIDTPTGIITINRYRGSYNDLYWLESDGETLHRGKSLTDTQTLLEARLGVTAEEFIEGSYIHQFSKADSFFTASAKDRRAVFEKIADQSFAINLSDKASEARKAAKKNKALADQELSRHTGRLEALNEELPRLQLSLSKWEEDRKALLSNLTSKYNSFDKDRAIKLAKLKTASQDFQGEKSTAVDRILAEMEALKAKIQPSDAFDSRLAEIKKDMSALNTEKCPTCNSPVSSNKRFDLSVEQGKLKDAQALNNLNISNFTSLQDKLRRQVDAPDLHQVEAEHLKTQENPYSARIQETEGTENPFLAQVGEAKHRLGLANAAVREAETQVAALAKTTSHLSWIYDKSFELRGIMMEKVVSQIERATNSYLETYFDAALRVRFSLEGSDKLQVGITNDGHRAPFAQLSGGERAMLKLCFSLSRMKAVQNKVGRQFSLVMLDEAMNGLDDALKVKAFSLLQSLEKDYSTVFIIDHCEDFKNMFTSRFIVEKSGSRSSLYTDEPQNNAKRAGITERSTKESIQP